MVCISKAIMIMRIMVIKALLLFDAGLSHGELSPRPRQGGFISGKSCMHGTDLESCGAENMGAFVASTTNKIRSAFWENVAEQI